MFGEIVSRVGKLRREGSSPHSIQMQIHRMQGYVCFFEGQEDPKFYFNKIRGKVRDTNCQKFSCNGKESVLNLLKELKFRKGLKSLFFIDKDFDDYLEILQPLNDNLFITEGYSFENYLVIETTIQFLLDDYIIKNNAINKQEIIEDFRNAYQNFVEFIKPFTEKVIAHCKNGNKFNFCDIEDDFEKCFCINSDLDFKISKPDYQECLLRQIENLDYSAIELNITDSHKWIRGKFALLFLYRFCQNLETKLKVKDSITQKPRTDNGDGTMYNFIEMISNKIPTPPDLSNFLDKHIL